MKFVGIALVFGGYILVYAATARGGRFATEPWAGLFADAYTTTGNTNMTPSEQKTAGAEVGSVIGGIL